MYNNNNRCDNNNSDDINNTSIYNTKCFITIVLVPLRLYVHASHVLYLSIVTH